MINETPEHDNIRERALGLSGTHEGTGPFNVLNLSIPKWFVRRRAYQLPLRPASECTYGRRSTFLLAAVITSFAGFFFSFLPAQIRSEPEPDGSVFPSAQLLPLGQRGGRIPGDPSI